MFRRLGYLAANHPVRVLAAWIVVLIAVLAATPRLADVVSSSQATYLPASANSQQAQAILRLGFPASYSASTAVVAVAGPAGPRAAAVADYSRFAAHRLSPAPAGVASDALTPDLRGALDSRDGAVSLISLGWKQVDSSSAPATSVTNLRAYIASHPYPGVTAQVTGDVAINTDYQDQINKSSALTTLATVILVLAIMLGVFRSLTLPILPLATIGISILISMGVVAFLGTHGLVVSSNTPIFMIVLLAGAGTDYCLFLASRFKEELLAGKDAREAIIETMTHVGEAIASSAAAVVVGMGGMAFAAFGLFNTTGPAVALSVAITLVAALTLAPAVLRLLGRRAFWPARVETARPPRFWAAFAQTVTRNPIVALVALLALLLPLNAAVLKTGQNFNFLADLGPRVEAHAGFDTIKAHFGAGNALPNTLVIAADHSLRNAADLARLDSLDAQLAAMQGVNGVQGPTRPAGAPIPYTAFATNARVRTALARNLSADGREARFSLTTVADPYGQAARDLIARVRGIAQGSFPGAQVHTTGASPAASDIHDVISSDLVRIALFVLGGIFLVLVVLLRGVAAPIYLLATVLLSLGATLGVTTLVFQGIGGQDGLVFWVPFLILTMLIGLSTDYNILLISRVREEVARGGDYRAAVAVALEKTGGIITTCGLILAGTFGSLMLASVTGLRELGFAVLVGVLLDTFLIRSVLVPALVVLVGQFTLRPRRISVALPVGAARELDPA